MLKTLAIPIPKPSILRDTARVITTKRLRRFALIGVTLSIVMSVAPITNASEGTQISEAENYAAAMAASTNRNLCLDRLQPAVNSAGDIYRSLFQRTPISEKNAGAESDAGHPLGASLVNWQRLQASMSNECQLIFDAEYKLALAAIVAARPIPAPKIDVGIWLISGRTSEIFGRQDGIADGQGQIQWVTCLESQSGPLIYPKRDNLNYAYTVSGPSGVIDSGTYAPTWIDSMSSCTGNQGGNNYTVAYNLTGLIAGTTYKFTVNGSIAGAGFTSTKYFTTLGALTPSTPIRVETQTSTTTASPTRVETQTSTTTASPTRVETQTSATTSSPTRVETQTSTTIFTPAPTPTASSAETITSTSSPTPVTPAVARPVSSPEIVESDGSEEEPAATLAVTKKSNGKYQIRINSNIAEEQFIITATKKGSKAVTYKATTNDSGDVIILTSRNLSGFTVTLRLNGEYMDKEKIK